MYMCVHAVMHVFAHVCVCEVVYVSVTGEHLFEKEVSRPHTNGMCLHRTAHTINYTHTNTQTNTHAIIIFAALCINNPQNNLQVSSVAK